MNGWSPEQGPAFSSCTQHPSPITGSGRHPHLSAALLGKLIAHVKVLTGQTSVPSLVIAIDVVLPSRGVLQTQTQVRVSMWEVHIEYKGG